MPSMPRADEGREMLSIPVVGLAHTNLHMASALGELFAIVTCELHSPKGIAR